jgi:guanylate kinase
MENVKISRRGLMLVLSSPSGAGKSTISKALLRRVKDLTMSVSMTTRPMRPGEIEGEDYYFIDRETFNSRMHDGEFLEYATVFGHSYGTSRAPVEELLSVGHDVLFDVDWQGTQQLAENARDDLVSVFVLPPSIKELERRLHSRAQDSSEVVAMRMAKANSEMSHWREYDYIIVNGDIDVSVDCLVSVLMAERLRRDRQTGLGNFVRDMCFSQ